MALDGEGYICAVARQIIEHWTFSGFAERLVVIRSRERAEWVSRSSKIRRICIVRRLRRDSRAIFYSQL